MPNHRQSLLRNLATSLILYEEIITTKAKAKKVKAVIEHLISRCRKNNLASRRWLLGFLLDKKAVKKVFEVIIPRYQKINSGYVLSYKLAPRLGDSAPLVMLRLKEDKTAEVKSTKEQNGQKESNKEPAKNVKTHDKKAKTAGKTRTKQQDSNADN